MYRENLIERAEALLDAGEMLPLDLITELLSEGVDVEALS